jgi:hypothetical protein
MDSAQSVPQNSHAMTMSSLVMIFARRSTLRRWNLLATATPDYAVPVMPPPGDRTSSISARSAGALVTCVTSRPFNRESVVTRVTVATVGASGDARAIAGRGRAP